MIAVVRRGLCPTLSAPMRTGDGLLVRLNPVAGGFSVNALIGLAEAAARHGNGLIEVTARGNLQVRGLTEASATRFESEIAALGIAVRSGVPVETGPLAGIDPNEIADPRPLAHKIRSAIEAAGLGGRLGPKVSVVVDGGGSVSLDGVAADIRLVAKRTVQGIAWRLLVGGDRDSSVDVSVLEERDAIGITLTILAAIADAGMRARARDLPPSRIDWVRRLRSTHSASVLPGVRAEERDASQSSGKAEAVYFLGDDHFAVGIGLPFGAADASRLIALLRSAAALGATELRLAPRHALLALGLTKAGAARLRVEARLLGFIADRSDPRNHVSACAGAPACASGHIAARAIAEAIATEFGEAIDDTISVHVSGCAKGCARPAPADVTLVGGEDSIDLVLGGTAGSPALARAPLSERAVKAFGRIAELLRGERREGQSAFASLARLGPARVAEAFAQE